MPVDLLRGQGTARSLRGARCPAKEPTETKPQSEHHVIGCTEPALTAERSEGTGGPSGGTGRGERLSASRRC